MTTPGNSAGSHTAIVTHPADDRSVRRPVRADVVDDGMAEIIHFVAGGSNDHHAALLRVARGVLNVLQNGALPGFIGAEI